MKTPTRILVGGPEVTSAFVLMGLALARRAMMRAWLSGWLLAPSRKVESRLRGALVRAPDPHHNSAVRRSCVRKRFRLLNDQ